MKRITSILAVIFLVSGTSFAGFDKKITFPAKKLPAVTFDHGKHLEQEGINCKICHPAIFAKMKAGANKIKMAAINKGKFCGVCHKAKGKAFAIKDNCVKCHVKA